MTDEEVQRVMEAIDTIGLTGDPTQRARQLTQLLDNWAKRHGKVREMRQRAVKEMHDSGMTYREIGEEIGVSFGRVRQIIYGVTGPANSAARPLKDDPTD